MSMNKKAFRIYLLICLIIFLLVGTTSCKDEILEIEENNTYRWQKFMNAEEYEQLDLGMSYLDVVKVAGGAGKEVAPNIYEWNDELLFTKGYRITFEEDRLIEKVIVPRRGNSNR
jgi:hypothetical protein